MSAMGDFVIGLGEAYERKHPNCGWEAAMKAVCESPKEIKGYLTSFGYMGWINGKYQLFATENEYYDTVYA